MLVSEGLFTRASGPRTAVDGQVSRAAWDLAADRSDDPIVIDEPPWAAHTDVEVWRSVEQARRRGRTIAPADLRGGTLHQALRQLPGAVPGSEVQVDVVAVRIDGQRHWFTSHLVARHSRIGGRVVAVANVPWRSGALAATESDPTDGLVEVIDAELGVGDRLKIRSARRATARSSAFPRQRRSQVASIDIELGRPTPVFLDGTEVAVARYLSLAVEPGALPCWI